MRFKIFQVDAFSEHVFQGNPAAVVPLPAWPEDWLLQAIAQENNLSETAFFVAIEGGYELRWFTPRAEVDLCGHATLASAHVLFAHLGHAADEVRFLTRSGWLTVSVTDDGLAMDFPALMPQPVDIVPDALAAGLGAAPLEVLAASDYIAVFDSESKVAGLKPDFSQLQRLGLRGVIATAAGDDIDFVSRCFYPKLDVNEDPVTGSAHCQSAPFWAQRLGRRSLSARQLSARGGRIDCRVEGERVVLVGQAVDYLRGEIWVDG
jgi:PhzF family phenazine biosynthesis protein